MSIQALPSDVVAQIKSSTTITSLNGVACELLRNSLDATSTKVEITVDYVRGYCMIEDDGLGISPSEFSEKGGLGKLHHTSKWDSNTLAHGKYGRFLASLSAVSLLSVTSHHHLYRSHNTLTMHKSEVVSRQIPAPAQQYLSYYNHGTRVTVRDLFGNMPVRVKQRALMAERPRGNSREWEDLKRDIVALLLCWPLSVSVILRDIGSNQKMTIQAPPKTQNEKKTPVDMQTVCMILFQASLLPLNDSCSWVYVSASNGKLDINGIISLHPSPTKHVQFLSFGIEPVIKHDQSIIHEDINRLFWSSGFGKELEASASTGSEIDSEIDSATTNGRFKRIGYTNGDLRGRKGIDRWPMFYINIRQMDTSQDFESPNIDYFLNEKGSARKSFTELLHAMILEFLTRYNFRSEGGNDHQVQSKAKDVNVSSPPQILGSSTSVLLEDRRPNKANSPDLNRNFGNVRKLSVPQRINRDSFGTNVKMPSFRKSSPKLDSPLDSWPRVKSGALRTPFQKNLTIKRPLSAPPTSTSASDGSATIILSSKSDLAPNVPLISSTGRITRRPFDTQKVRKPHLQRCRSNPFNPQNQPPDSSTCSYDDVISWINPFTKTESLVSKRTGLTMPRWRVSEDSNQLLSLTSHKKSVSASRISGGDVSQAVEESSPWIRNILKEWDNPVFRPTESSIPQTVFEGLDKFSKDVVLGQMHHCSASDIDLAFKESSSGISREALKSAEVISQVDNKFILVKVGMTTVSTDEDANLDDVLILIDQHAADERIRIEALMEELCTSPPDSSLPTGSRVVTSPLDKPLNFEVSTREAQLLRENKEHFTSWGILFDCLEVTSKAEPKYRLTVQYLPPGIIARCRLDPRLLIEVIRSEIWKIHEEGMKPVFEEASAQSTWFQHIHRCPQGIIDMLNSRACRSAIMFNDKLNHEQCHILVKRLAECRFPFQCAHGRPSLVPLLKLGGWKPASRRQRENNSDFGASFRNWKIGRD